MITHNKKVQLNQNQSSWTWVGHLAVAYKTTQINTTNSIEALSSGQVATAINMVKKLTEKLIAINTSRIILSIRLIFLRSILRLPLGPIKKLLPTII